MIDCNPRDDMTKKVKKKRINDTLQVWIVPSTSKGPCLRTSPVASKRVWEKPGQVVHLNTPNSSTRGSGLRRTDVFDVSYDYRKMALKCREGA
jgi:hypothetical protein